MQSVKINFNKAQSFTKKFNRNNRKDNRNQNSRKNNKSNNNFNNNIIDIASKYYFVYDIIYFSNKNKCFNKDIVCSNFSYKKTNHKNKNCI